LSDQPPDPQLHDPKPAAASEPPKPILAADRYQIFEQAALDRLRSGSDQSKPVGFLPLPVRLAAISAITITGLGVLWSLLARVPVQVNGLATIVPEGSVSSAQARVDGVLYYQVSGVGPDLLSPVYRQRNHGLSRFWEAAVVQTRPTLPIDQLLQLVNGAQLAPQGQALLLPGARDDVQAFDQLGRIGSLERQQQQRQLFYGGNTVIAQIDNPPAIEELDAMRRLTSPKLALERQTSQDRRQRAQAYGSVDGLIVDQLRDKERELSQRRALLQRLQKLWSKGYVSETQLLQEQASVNSLDQQVVQLRRDRLGNNFSGTDQRQQATQADLNALQATDQLQSALVSYLAKAFTIAPPTGIYLVAKYLQTGMEVHVGDELFTYSLTPPSLPRRIPVFVDAATLQQLTEGMRVLVTPKGISRAQYGGILGVVDEVGRLPLSGDALAAVAGGRSLGNAIAQGVPTPYLVKVKLEVSEPAFCRQLLSRRCYSWSTNRVPPFPVRMGTQADVQITTIYRRPIEFVMPALRQALGLVVENR
jgi:multidrug resistance efflux pump